MEENKESQENLQEKREQALWRLHEERTEEALWDCVVAFQEFEFHTYSGLPYSYHMKYGRSGTYTKELWINRREKSKSLVFRSPAVIPALSDMHSGRSSRQDCCFFLCG